MLHDALIEACQTGAVSSYDTLTRSPIHWGSNGIMNHEAEELNRLLGRYRMGRYEAAYTVQLLKGLLSNCDTEAKLNVLQSLWSDLCRDFEMATKGETIAHWIFPVAIPCWVEFGNTSVMAERLLGMLVPDDLSVARAWTVHLSGFLCDALDRHYERFTESTIANVKAWVGQFKFAASSGIKDYQYEPELIRAVNRIDDIIEDKYSRPLDAALLAASNSNRSIAGSFKTSPVVPGNSIRRRRNYNDPIPSILNELEDDIDYWTGRLGEGEPGSNHEYWVGTRLTKLQHAHKRLIDQERLGEMTTTSSADLL